MFEFLSATGDLESFPLHVLLFSATSESKNSKAVALVSTSVDTVPGLR